MQSKCVASSVRGRLLARADGRDLDVVVAADQLDDRLALRRRRPRPRAAASRAGRGSSRARRTPRRGAPSSTGFSRKATAPARSACWRPSAPETMCTGMWRVSGWRLSRSSSVQPSTTGSWMSSTIASGRNSLREREPAVAAERDEALEAALARHPEQRAREVRVVLDDQDDAVAGVERRRGRRRPRSAGAATGSTSIDTSAGRVVGPCELGRGLGRAVRLRRRRVHRREEEREGAALARRALGADLAAEQARDLAADREPEAGAAVAAARRAVGLLERLEDQPQLVGRDADAGVRRPRSTRRSRTRDRRLGCEAGAALGAS